MIRLQTKERVSFAEVRPPWWDDKPAVIVGAGPSLKGFDLNRLRPFHVVAVNGSMFDLPWADAWITVDMAFTKAHAEFLKQEGPPLYIGIPVADAVGGPYPPHIWRARYLRYEMRGGELSFSPKVISCGGTSGFAAYNFTVLKRARKIGLFGFDYENTGHYDNTPYAKIKTTPDWDLWARMFNSTVRQLGTVQVINANPDSKVTAFPRMEHDQCLAWLCESL